VFKGSDEGNEAPGARSKCKLTVLTAGREPSRGLRKHLEAKGARVVETSMERLHASLLESRPDAVVLMDPEETVHSGLVSDVVAAAPEAVVVCIGQSCELVDLLVILRAGAAGLLPASTPPRSVANAVMASLEGEAPIPRRRVWGLVEEFRSGGGHVMLPIHGQSEPAQLSDREWDVLCLLNQGLSTREVAERIYISAVTVRSHVASIKRKLGVEDRESMLQAIVVR
jgi:DNA-binding NarL/FixJ family response regulator